MGYLEKKSAETDILKQEIVLAAFRPSATTQSELFVPEQSEKRDMLKRVGINEDVLPSALLQIGVSEERINQIVLPFFKRATQAVSQVPSLKQIQSPEQIDDAKLKAIQEWSAIRPQVRQIDQLAELIENYNNEVNRLYSPFKTYLDLVNEFLGESHKNLSFGSNGSLTETKLMPFLSNC